VVVYGNRKLGWREIWLAGVILGLILPRAYLVLKFRSTLIDSDEAIVGLMARHILQGRELPIWYYGQAYLGSLEPAWTAVLFAVMGATPIVLKLATFCWFCAALVVQYLLAREIAGPLTARLNTLLLCTSPAFLAIYSFKAMGGYMAMLFLGTFALLVSTRALRGELTPQRAALLGLSLGLAWWTHFLAVAYIVPIVLILGIKFRDRLLSRASGVFAACFLVGSFPFWLYNVFRSWRSLELRAPHYEPFGSAMLGFFQTAIPIFLGTRAPYAKSDYFLFGSLIALVLFVVAAVVPLRLHFVESRRKQILNGSTLLLGILAFIPFLFAASGFGGTANEPRYLIPLYSGIYVLILMGFSKPIQLALAGLLLFVHLNGTLRVTSGPENSEPTAPLVAFLQKNHIRTAYTPYWNAYRLTFESGEEIIATPTTHDLVRYVPYLDMARSDPSVAYIRLNEQKFGIQNITPPTDYPMTRVGNWEVFLPPSLSQ
jgi:hypothetical protein